MDSRSRPYKPHSISFRLFAAAAEDLNTDIPPTLSTPEGVEVAGHAFKRMILNDNP
jgi:hypothetical protein